MPIGALDIMNLLFIPLMVMTAVQVRASWRSLWDDELTPYDRQLLQRIVLFLLLPLVVLLHELGHVATVKLFGGTVRKFHYAFVYGYVVPGQVFPPDQTVWLFFSGNLVQILIGLAAGAGALAATSPPVVALLSYLSLWSVGGTAILYALLSATGMYGDWIQIYSTNAPHLVPKIGAFHALTAALTLWSLYGEKPRIWFARKTDRRWNAEQELLHANPSDSPDKWLELAESYNRQGFSRTAKKCLRRAELMALNRGRSAKQ